jgi:opacity protein-like surface antigen
MEEKPFYIGVDGGSAYPIKKSFKKKVEFSAQLPKVDGVGNIKSAPIYSIKIGYNFDPNAALEFSHSKVNHIPFAFSSTTPAFANLNLKTKVTVDTYMLSMIYKMEDLGWVQPFFGIGAGLGIIKPRAADNDFAVPGLPVDVRVSVSNKKSRVFVGQLIFGIEKRIHDNITLDAAVKVRYVKNGKLTFGSSIPSMNVVNAPKVIKQSIGFSDFVIGMRFNF